MKAHPKILFLPFFLALLMLACSSEEAAPGYQGQLYSIDPVFVDFYKALGGEDLLGPAISPGFEKSGKKYQYTVAVLMVYDSQAASIQKFQLAPLTQMMGITDAPEVPPVEQDNWFINNHLVWEEVRDTYNNLGRIGVVGVPETRVHFNPKERIYEQYFTNMAFYRPQDAPLGAVHLLPLGKWVCQQRCADGNFIGAPNIPHLPSDETLRQVDTAMNETAARIGYEITGNALTETYVNLMDGKFEKIYDNIVLNADSNEPTRPYVRQITSELGYEPGKPVSRSGGSRDYFYPVQDGLGYNVRAAFMDYITLHGGLENFGYPIGEEYPVSQIESRQCFEKICLEYDTLAPEALRIRPMALGYIYSTLHYRANTSIPDALDYDKVSLNVWEEYPEISSQQSQIIGIIVFEQENIPVSNVEVVVMVDMPDGSQKTYYPPLTGLDGKTMLTLEPFQEKSGKIIAYQACIVGLGQIRKCADKRGFTIWDVP